jgi:hypothetical protein
VPPHHTLVSFVLRLSPCGGPQQKKIHTHTTKQKKDTLFFVFLENISGLTSLDCLG